MIDNLDKNDKFCIIEQIITNSQNNQQLFFSQEKYHKVRQFFIGTTPIMNEAQIRLFIKANRDKGNLQNKQQIPKNKIFHNSLFSKFMNITPQVIILRNPDGSIQIGTQPQFKNKKLLVCFQCKREMIFDASLQTVQCSNCKTPNQVPNIQR
ncbi:hypothetical protein pb186bvf_003945 [Paramecium bursaria]